MTKYLFIGGEFDGSRIKCEDLDVIHLPSRGGPLSLPPKTISYIRTGLWMGADHKIVYVAASLPHKSALEIIVGSYPDA